MKKLRVTIPRNSPKEVLSLAKKVLDKHRADGDESVIKQLNWDVLGNEIEEAIRFHQEAETYLIECRKKFQDRDIRMNSVVEGLRNVRDILTGSHKANMKKLGNWGFEVIEAVKKTEQNDSLTR